MNSSRFKILAGVGGLFAIVLLGYWISGWGTITLHADKVPLSKVIKSIERQGNVKIVTNADPTTPVSLEVRRAPVFDVIDTLAIRLDGNAQLAYVAAPDRNQITNVLAAFRSSANPGGWSIFSAGFGGRSMDPEGITPDPREMEWKVTAGGDSNLQSLFEQGAQKTGALFATPESWNPTVAKLPKEGKTGSVASSLAKAAQGQIEEIFLITVRPPRTEEPTAEEGPRRAPPTVFSSSRRGQEGNPEWIAERVAAQMATHRGRRKRHRSENLWRPTWSQRPHHSTRARHHLHRFHRGALWAHESPLRRRTRQGAVDGPVIENSRGGAETLRIDAF